MGACALFAGAADVQAGEDLPPPYVSRALDAILIEVNDVVRTRFHIDPAAHGAMVVSVAPGGTADKLHIRAGDVIGQLYGSAIEDPIMVDEIAGYWLKHGKSQIGIEWQSGSNTHHRPASMTEESFTSAVTMSSISSWSSFESSEFDYGEYVASEEAVMNDSLEQADSEIAAAEENDDFAGEDLDQSEDADDDGIVDSEEAEEP